MCSIISKANNFTRCSMSIKTQSPSINSLGYFSSYTEVPLSCCTYRGSHGLFTSISVPHKRTDESSQYITANVLCKRWDKSSRKQRIDILTQFLESHRLSTSAEVERSLGHGSLLFFTRITAWLRATYQLGYALSTQLVAISLFLQGQRFLSNFVETGGIHMLTDILRFISPQYPDDKDNVLLLLIHLSNGGRVYRELICERDGVKWIVKSTRNEKNSKTLAIFAALFLALGQGNPRKAPIVHSGLLYLILNSGEDIALFAATTLRTLQQTSDRSIMSNANASTVRCSSLSNTCSSDDSPHTVAVVGLEDSEDSECILLSALFRLLWADNVKLRFEGTELLSMASRNYSLVIPIADRCMDIIDQIMVLVSGSTSNSEAKGGTSSPLNKEFDKTQSCDSDIITHCDNLKSIHSSAYYNDETKYLEQHNINTDSNAANLMETCSPRDLARHRRMQLSCGRLLCFMILQQMKDEVKVKLCNYIEMRSGHISLLKYIECCEKDNDAVEDVCKALMVLCTFTSTSKGMYSFEDMLKNSKTTQYLSSLLGKDVISEILQGSSMSSSQIVALKEALQS